jgi:hypothetical protein
VKQPVRVHNSNYSIDSGEKTIKISEIIGNNIRVRSSLGFVPSAGLKVDLIGFQDNGKPYLLI